MIAMHWYLKNNKIRVTHLYIGEYICLSSFDKWKSNNNYSSKWFKTM